MISPAEPQPADLLIAAPQSPRWLRLMRWLGGAVLFQAGLWRATGEAVLIGSLPLALLTLAQLQGAVQQASVFDTFGTISTLVLALRLRHSAATGKRRIRNSIGRVALFSLVMTVCLLLWGSLWYRLGLINVSEVAQLMDINAAGSLNDSPLRGPWPVPVMFIVAGLGYLALFGQNLALFAVYRFGLSLWLKLEERRRRFLRWSLTRAHLLVVSAVSGMAFLVGLLVADDSLSLPLTLRVLALTSKLISFAVLLPLALLVVLPPFALLSNVITRGLTRRLELLVRATSAIRAGEYAARIVVEGEDEIAQLQHDFNAMAAELERAMKELHHQQEQLAAEKAKSELLLLNILPKSIADQLKEDPRTIADSFADATVLFADIVDFTVIAGQLSPTELVAWLNDIFSTFDQLADHFGLEKIKTIGDAYMVVGGLPAPRPDHALAMIRMALAMQEAVGNLRTPRGQPVRMRIGIHTGAVVAGVIGTRKFIYDLWGDTVNTASRMESHGLPGAIQVTSETYALVRHEYVFEQRGAIQVKGKGPIETYLLHHDQPVPALLG